MIKKTFSHTVSNYQKLVHPGRGVCQHGRGVILKAITKHSRLQSYCRSQSLFPYSCTIFHQTTITTRESYSILPWRFSPRSIPTCKPDRESPLESSTDRQKGFCILLNSQHTLQRRTTTRRKSFLTSAWQCRLPAKVKTSPLARSFTHIHITLNGGSRNCEL